MALDLPGGLELARWWWTFVLRGVLAIAFGVLAFLAPAWGIAILVALFAVWAILDGVASLVAGARGRGRDGSWLEILEGVAGLLAGGLAIIFPAFAAEVLVILIGAWAIVTGAFEILAAIRLREEIEGEVWLGLAGVASILFGVLVFLFPAAGAISLVWLIGSFAIVFGVFMLVLGWRLRGLPGTSRP